MEVLAVREDRCTTMLAAALSLALASCTTASSPGGAPAGGAWQVDSLAARCVGALLISTIGGGLVGAAVGGNSRSVAIGAGVGAAAGTGICAVMAALDARDKARIREAQLQAARTGQIVQLSYAGDDGRQRAIAVVPGPAVSAPQPLAVSAPPSPSTAEVAAQEGARICRPLNTSVSVEGGGGTQFAQMTCRDPNGNWVAVSTTAAQ